jgi:AraC-like DNA-binding protein
MRRNLGVKNVEELATNPEGLRFVQPTRLAGRHVQSPYETEMYQLVAALHLQKCNMSLLRYCAVISTMASRFYRCPESGLGIQVFRHERPIAFPPHCHNEMAVVVCTEGVLESTQFGQRELLPDGQVLVTNSGIAHSSRYCIDGRATAGVTIELDGDILQRLGYSSTSLYMTAQFQGKIYQPEVVRIAETIQKESYRGAEDSVFLMTALARQIIVLTLREWPKALIRNYNLQFTTQLPRNELVRAIELMNVIPIRDFSVDELATRMHRSTSAFSRLFARSVGDSPYSFYLNRVLYQAAHLLVTTNDPVKVIALNLGFDNFSHFSNSFRTKWNLTPTTYRKLGTLANTDKLPIASDLSESPRLPLIA